MVPSDAILWARSRDGDEEAFGLLFDRHGDAIYNYCFRRIGNWATAEDLLSIVFLEAWQQRKRDLPGDKILPWLYGIATNVVRNSRRSERRFGAALRRVPVVEATLDFSASSDARIDAERRIGPAIQLLGKLKRLDREVLVLCDVMELSYEDAAFALGIPLGTVRSRLSRARQNLMELEPNLRT